MRNKLGFTSHRRSGAGFTLVELLVVVGLIGIITGVVLLVLNPTGLRNKSQDGRRKSDLGLIQTAIELYYSDNRNFPPTAAWKTNLQPDFIQVVPSDPDGGDYCYSNLGSNYVLCANLETESGSSASCGGSTYNYCLSSPF